MATASPDLAAPCRLLPSEDAPDLCCRSTALSRPEPAPTNRRGCGLGQTEARIEHSDASVSPFILRFCARGMPCCHALKHLGFSVHSISTAECAWRRAHAHRVSGGCRTETYSGRNDVTPPPLAVAPLACVGNPEQAPPSNYIVATVDASINSLQQRHRVDRHGGAT